MKESKKITMTVAALAEHLNGVVSGDDTLIITGVNALAAADKNELTFITAKTHVTKLIKSKAAAVIVSREVEYADITQIIVPKAEKALIAALKLFAPKLTVQPGISPTAVIAPTAQVSENASVGAGVHIAENVKIGSNTIIAPGCCIGENTSIGNNCRIDSNVVIYHNCKIGSDCIIQANSVVGSTGFGYYFIDGSHQLIPHNGGVIIEDCVDIGANTCIDRAKFGNTIIGAGTKIDNLVQIAHNVVMGKCCIVVAQVGIAGSVTLGNGVVFAAQSGVADNVTIGDGVVVGGRAGLISNAEPGKKFLGFPAGERNEVLRLWAIQRNLPAMNKQLKELTRKVAELEAAKNDKN